MKRGVLSGCRPDGRNPFLREPMAFTELELRRYERFIANFMDRRRPPPEIRDKLDFCYRITGHSVVLYSVRPDWDDASTTVEFPLAKATFVRTQNCWRVFWMRSDLKWHGYEPNVRVASLEAFLNVVDRDENSCFFG